MVLNEAEKFPDYKSEGVLMEMKVRAAIARLLKA